MEIELVCFSAVWCGPCRAMKPVIDLIEMENPDIHVKRIDISDDKQMEHYTDSKITAVPTFLIIIDNKQHAKLVGLQSKATLLKSIAEAKESF